MRNFSNTIKKNPRNEIKLLKPKIGKIKEKKASELLENAWEKKSETPSPEHTEITLKSNNAELDFKVSVFQHFSEKQTANPRSKKKEQFTVPRIRTEGRRRVDGQQRFGASGRKLGEWLNWTMNKKEKKSDYVYFSSGFNYLKGE